MFSGSARMPTVTESALPPATALVSAAATELSSCCTDSPVPLCSSASAAVCAVSASFPAPAPQPVNNADAIMLTARASASVLFFIIVITPFLLSVSSFCISLSLKTFYFYQFEQAIRLPCRFLHIMHKWQQPLPRCCCHHISVFTSGSSAHKK